MWVERGNHVSIDSAFQRIFAIKGAKNKTVGFEFFKWEVKNGRYICSGNKPVEQK